MRNLRHANNRGRFLGVLRSWHRRPDAGFDMKSFFSVEIFDLLKIGQAKHVDFALKQAAVWYLTLDFFEFQGLGRKIEFEEVIVAGRVVRSPDDIKPCPGPRSQQVLKQPEWTRGRRQEEPQRSFFPKKRPENKVRF